MNDSLFGIEKKNKP